jgi:hypothetical protein
MSKLPRDLRGAVRHYREKRTIDRGLTDAGDDEVTPGSASSPPTAADRRRYTASHP